MKSLLTPRRMKTQYAAFVLAALALLRTAALAQSGDPGWPRIFQQDGKQLTIYQPQVDYWHGFTNIHFRCAIAVKGVAKQEKFGVAEIDAVTVTDQADRIVVVVPTQRDIRFANTPDAELAALRLAIDQLRPPGHPITISLDRVIAYLDPASHSTQKPVELNLAPPRIFYSRQPAIQVMFIGEPQFRPVETNRTDLLFALNTNWDLFYDTLSQRYFLLNQDSWLTAPDVRGPWTAAQTLAPSLYLLPGSANWATARENIPGKRAKVVPIVFVSTQPAELIVTQGEPNYTPIKGTQLLRVTDTDSALFLNSGDGQFYYLVAGRWFRAASLDGPWAAASADLPADFARIPDTDPASFVKATVPGTRQAQDAVLLASVPRTTTVDVNNGTAQVIYNGAPQFVPIANTVVQYAVNSPNQVFLVGGQYYCCSQGVGLVAGAATGPWAFCTSVPAAIYTIPPSSPMYNVTYVVVQSATPTTVVYSQTSGYGGEYVAATGVLMFGAGMLVGAAIANNNSYCYPPYPSYYSYGCSATYHYGNGGYYSASAAAYGPYGGASYSTAYNPTTGTYARSSSAYGAYGSATKSAAYNPYTGTAAASRSVSTPYGSASQAAAYNPYPGARAAGGQVSTASGSAGWGAAYNPTTGQGAAGGYKSGQYGSAGAVTTTGGGSAAAWNTQSGQGAVGKTASGNVYASNGDTVYKQNPNGGWSENSGSGWSTVQSPQQQAQTQASSYQQKAQSEGSSYQQHASSARPPPVPGARTSPAWSPSRNRARGAISSTKAPSRGKVPAAATVGAVPAAAMGARTAAAVGEGKTVTK
jgi:hypothetical protein